MNNWCICWFSRISLLGILIFKGRTARRLYKSFGVKGLIVYVLPRPKLTQHITPKRRYILTIQHSVTDGSFVVTVMRTLTVPLPPLVSIISVREVLPKLRFSSMSYHSTNAPYSHSFICHRCCTVCLLISHQHKHTTQ
jgi:hypothetical protein